MSIKYVCDCCGTELSIREAPGWNLMLFKSICEASLEPPEPAIAHQELCSICAEKITKHYQYLQRISQKKPLKRICQTCGIKNDYDLICPVCQAQNWSIEEE